MSFCIFAPLWLNPRSSQQERNERNERTREEEEEDSRSFLHDLCIHSCQSSSTVSLALFHARDAVGASPPSVRPQSVSITPSPCPPPPAGAPADAASVVVCSTLEGHLLIDTQRAPTTKRNAKHTTTTPTTKERPLYHAHTPLEIGSTRCLSGEGATGSGPSPSCGVSTALLAMEKDSLPVSNTSKSTCALPKEKGSTCV